MLLPMLVPLSSHTHGHSKAIRAGGDGDESPHNKGAMARTSILRKKRLENDPPRRASIAPTAFQQQWGNLNGCKGLLRQSTYLWAIEHSLSWATSALSPGTGASTAANSNARLDGYIYPSR
jgi:hypothetical protein